MEIRGFSSDDATAMRELFIRVNRLLAPADMREAFEIYIARSLAEEIDKVSDYYGERKGGFWVAVEGERIVGMFGLEPASDGACTSTLIFGAEGLGEQCWISREKNAGDASDRE